MSLFLSTMSVSEDGGAGRLSQVIRDYIELEYPSISPSSSSTSHSVNHHLSSLASLQEIVESVTVVEAEILEKIFCYSRDLEPSKLRKWIVTKLGMDQYQASLCRTSWLTRTKFSHPSVSKYTGDYEYIDVIMKSDDNAAITGGRGHEGMRLIVDIDFRSQFELSKPTPQYEELSNSLPKVFVGTEMKLEKIISLVCPAVKLSLRERGFHIPPWRKANYMHSKWLSENCKKISFSELHHNSF